jgi:hypothetical protein
VELPSPVSESPVKAQPRLSQGRFRCRLRQARPLSVATNLLRHMTDVSQPGSFPEGRPASFLVAAKFANNLVLSNRSQEFVAVLLEQPIPSPEGIHMSSTTVGSWTEFNVLRSFAAGDLILVEPNPSGQGVGFTYFATLVSGAAPAAPTAS